jgi:AcrR family transcriptional regulator
MSMTSSRHHVKGVRSYDASRRQERARQQHAVALDAARDLFLTRGFVGTTVEAIADAAGVSTATIYKSYGGKAGLVRDLCRLALAGEGPVPAEERSNALRSEPDPRQVMKGWGQLASEVAPRVAPLLLVLRDAAQADPEAAFLHHEFDRDRLARMTDNARYLTSVGRLRAGLTTSDARDVLWLCSSPELYDLLVNQRKWSIAKYSRFVTDTMTTMLV